MPLNRTAVRDYLKSFQFSDLFTQEVGWNNPGKSLPLLCVVRTQSGNRSFELVIVAEKKGVAVYHCPAPHGTPLPDASIRKKIETEVSKRGALEHVILFTDEAKTLIILQTALRRPGQPVRRPEYRFDLSGTGEAVIQRLDRLVFTLDQEDALTVIDVVERLKGASIAEKVTKKFYDSFAKERLTFAKFISGIQAEGDRAWYASVMLNRLMFVYFIQAKGFLDGNTNYLSDRLTKVQDLAGQNQFHSFYRGFLLHLFHDGLGKRETERCFDKQLAQLIGRVPYLNGGLFDVHSLERDHPEINIPDDAFKRLFDFFDKWRWHLDERDSTLRKDDEINPDVLGYIFEKYINQKQMGAYYTKEDITDYISKNCIVPWLFQYVENHLDKAGRDSFTAYWKALVKDDPDAYIYPAVRHGVTWDYNNKCPLVTELALPPEIAAGVAPASLHNPVGAVDSISEIETIRLRRTWQKSAPSEYALPTEIWREVVARRQRYAEVKARLVNGQMDGIQDFITLNLDIRQFAQDVIANCPDAKWLRHFWNGLQELTVLDPTCGSGAFLFAALNLLQPLYEGVLQRMEEMLHENGATVPAQALDDLPTPAEKAERTFQRVLGQVNDPSRHPTRRYFVFKEIILRNLYGVDIMPEAVEICKLRLFLKLVAQVEPEKNKPNLGVEPLPDVDFNVRAGNTLVGFATRKEMEDLAVGDWILKSELATVLSAAEDADKLFETFRKSQVDGDAKGQREVKTRLKEKLNDLRGRCDRALAEVYKSGLSEDADKFAAWRESHQPFHWCIEFYGIMKKGGFATIIGNPPYIDFKDLDVNDYKGYTTSGTNNLYSLILERCTYLGSGNHGYIVPISSISTEGYLSLQNIISKRSLKIVSFDDRPSHLFDGLDKNTLSILLFSSSTSNEVLTYATKLQRWSASERPFLFYGFNQSKTQISALSGAIPRLGSLISISIWSKIFRQRPLELSLSKRGHEFFYSRKVNSFLQILDFTPEVRSGDGTLRPPSEFKTLYASSSDQSNTILCALNSSLFRLFVDAVSDGSHLNKREVYGFPFEPTLKDSTDKKIVGLAKRLSSDIRSNSFMRTMQYKHDTLTVQCIAPCYSKLIIDEIDCILARHYGFTEEELDFIVNYDIKYRLGTAETEESDE